MFLTFSEKIDVWILGLLATWFFMDRLQIYFPLKELLGQLEQKADEAAGETKDEKKL